MVYPQVEESIDRFDGYECQHGHCNGSWSTVQGGGGSGSGVDYGDFKTKKDSGRSWRKIEHLVEGQVVEGVAEDGQTHLSFILVHLSIVILIQPHPQACPFSYLTAPTSFNSSVAPLPNEIDTDFIAPYMVLLINPMMRFISPRGMEVEGGFGRESEARAVWDRVWWYPQMVGVVIWGRMSKTRNWCCRRVYL